MHHRPHRRAVASPRRRWVVRHPRRLPDPPSRRPRRSRRRRRAAGGRRARSSPRRSAPWPSSAAGVFAITRISGDGEASGGADSPEAAAELLLDAIDDEDALGAVDVLLPGERETFREPMQRLVTQLTEWDVLSDDNLSGISGVDFTVTDRAVEATETNVDDIVNLTVSASVASKVDGEALPIGTWLREQIGEDEIAGIDEETDAEPGSFPVTAVEQDGRWYLSLFYTAAEQARAETDHDVPERGDRAGRRGQPRGRHGQRPAGRRRPRPDGARRVAEPERVRGPAALRAAVPRRRPGRARCRDPRVRRVDRDHRHGLRRVGLRRPSARWSPPGSRSRSPPRATR